MERASVFLYTKAGGIFWQLRALNEDNSVREVRKVIEMARSTLSAIGFNHCASIVENELKDIPRANKVQERDIRTIRNVATSLTKSMRVDADNTKLYRLTDLQYRVDDLMDCPERFFPQDVWPKISELARTDINEGTSALAFRLPTCAAFLILRATEDVLNDYYEYFIKDNPIKRDKRTMGRMIKALKNLPEDGSARKVPVTITIDLLDKIRADFRNPTGHPDATYDIDEAQEVLRLCSLTIGWMIHEIKPHVSKPPSDLETWRINFTNK